MKFNGYIKQNATGRYNCEFINEALRRKIDKWNVIFTKRKKAAAISFFLMHMLGIVDCKYSLQTSNRSILR